MRRKFVSKSLQRGMTLPEILIGGSIALAGFILLSIFLLGQYDAYRGRAEGEFIANVGTCGVEKARSMGALGSVTVVVSLNNGCYGRNPGIQNLGASNASLATTLVKSSNYAQGTCNLTGTNDGLYVETFTNPDECTHVVKGAADAGANKVSVIPSGGSEVVVKTPTGSVDLGAAALTTTCRGAAPIAVRACIRG